MRMLKSIPFIVVLVVFLLVQDGSAYIIGCNGGSRISRPSGGRSLSSRSLLYRTPSIPSLRTSRSSTIFTATSLARRSLPTKSTSSTRLFMAKSAANNNNEKSPNNRFFRRLLSKALPVSYLRRLYARYQGLSKRIRRILALQLAILVIFMAGWTQSYRGSGGGAYSSAPPIEVSYSSFLQLVEQQKQQPPPSPQSTSTTPVIDQVRIANDRIHYRLQPPSSTEQQQQQADSKDNNTPLSVEQQIPQRKPRFFKKQKPQQQTGIAAYTRKVAASPELIQQLRSNDIPFAAAPPPKPSTLLLLGRSAVLSFYLLILYRVYKNISTLNGGGGGKNEVMGQRALQGDAVHFDDIQGMDEAKHQVMELVDTIQHAPKYALLGARAPRGLLLVGPPGCGKTLLAKATAHTAGVPLLYCSGSDFVEMFVGRGAARVRKLFAQAQAMKGGRCILFIDELDALGKSRDSGGNSIGGMNFSRNDEAEQTLNQLLACMDGLGSQKGVCVLAATNRKEVLDPALLRPGRFDRIVTLSLPNAAGRESILRVHASKLPGFVECSGVSTNRPNALGQDNGSVDLSAVAAVTDGLSGAELEVLVNEAAIRAVRRVTAALQQNNNNVVMHVEARDFEQSVQSFYASRKPKGGVNDMLRNVWMQ